MLSNSSNLNQPLNNSPINCRSKTLVSDDDKAAPLAKDLEISDLIGDILSDHFDRHCQEHNMINFDDVLSPASDYKKHLESLEGSSTVREMSAANHFESRLQAKLEAKEKREFEQVLSKSITSESDAGQNETKDRVLNVRARKLKSKESFEERLQKKMIESRGVQGNNDISKTDVERETMRLQTNAEARHLKAKESYDERLRRKMNEVDVGQRETFDKVSNVRKAKESYDERLRRKMNEAHIISKANVDKNETIGTVPKAEVRKLKAKESFEERLKKKTSDAHEVQCNKNTKEVDVGQRETLDKVYIVRKAKESYDERLRRKMNEAHIISKAGVVQNGAMSTTPNVDIKLKAKESFEERLKKKMSDAHDAGHNRNSTDADVGPKLIEESFEKKNKDKMSRVHEVPPTNDIADAEMGQNKIMGRVAKAGARKLKKKESYDELIMRKMRESRTTAVYDASRNALTRSVPNVKTRKLRKIDSNDELLMRKMRESRATADDDVRWNELTESVPHVKTPTLKKIESYDDRLMRKLNQYDASTKANDEEAINLKCNESYEERLKKKLTESDITAKDDLEQNDAIGRVAQHLMSFKERMEMKLRESEYISEAEDVHNDGVHSMRNEEMGTVPNLKARELKVHESFEERFIKKMTLFDDGQPGDDISEADVYQSPLQAHYPSEDNMDASMNSVPTNVGRQSRMGALSKAFIKLKHKASK